jgi:hypothetical protein
LKEILVTIWEFQGGDRLFVSKEPYSAELKKDMYLSKKTMSVRKCSISHIVSL